MTVGEYIGEAKKGVLKSKKMAIQENGKRRVQLSIPKIVVGSLIGYTQ